MIVVGGTTQIGSTTNNYNYRKASTAQVTLVAPAGSDVGGNGGYSNATGTPPPNNVSTINTNSGSKLQLASCSNYFSHSSGR